MCFNGTKGYRYYGTRRSKSLDFANNHLPCILARGGSGAPPSSLSTAGRPIATTLAIQTAIHVESSLILARDYVMTWWNKINKEAWLKRLLRPVKSVVLGGVSRPTTNNTGAQRRRNEGHYYYWKQQQQQPYYERNNAMTRLLYPQRVVQLSVLAMVLSECIFFVGIRS